MSDTILQEIWKDVDQQTREKIAELIGHCARKRITAQCLETNLKVSLKHKSRFETCDSFY